MSLMRQDDGALALVKQDIPPIDSASNDDFAAAPLRPAGNTRNVSAVKKLAVAAKRMSAGAAHRRPVSTVVASGTDMATGSTADIGSSSSLTAMSPTVGHSKLAVTASGQAENTIDDQHKVIITSRMAVGSSLSPPFSPPRRAKKLDQTESPGSRQARAQASRTSTHSGGTTKQCETCQQVSANYGVAADAFRKRWCGSCAKSHGAVNPGRARRAQVTGAHMAEEPSYTIVAAFAAAHRSVQADSAVNAMAIEPSHIETRDNDADAIGAEGNLHA